MNTGMDDRYGSGLIFNRCFFEGAVMNLINDLGNDLAFAIFFEEEKKDNNKLRNADVRDLMHRIREALQPVLHDGAPQLSAERSINTESHS